MKTKEVKDPLGGLLAVAASSDAEAVERLLETV